MPAPKHGTRPIGVAETPGKKAYCVCGWSQKLPYCDGSHARLKLDCGPTVVEVGEAGQKWVCQCHQSKNMPWCDGTHKRIGQP
jgi:CDGSH-type Zn-finger protein